jgi:4'-phosphopantetheinyl transferase
MEDALSGHGQMIGGSGSAPGDESQRGSGLSLWWAPLDVPTPTLHGLAASLSSEEQQRGNRFNRRRDRERFLAARGWLRRLLAGQLHCAPGDVRIVTEHGGKPRIADSDLRFKAARSADIALYVTSWTMEVDVDVEAVRPTANVDAIATKFFSPAERRALAAVPSAQRLAAYYKCWTHKEAYVKGTGAGLTFSVRTLDV